jgi:hypothetical protein
LQLPLLIPKTSAATGMVNQISEGSDGEAPKQMKDVPIFHALEMSYGRNARA